MGFFFKLFASKNATLQDMSPNPDLEGDTENDVSGNSSSCEILFRFVVICSSKTLRLNYYTSENFGLKLSKASINPSPELPETSSVACDFTWSDALPSAILVFAI